MKKNRGELVPFDLDFKKDNKTKVEPIKSDGVISDGVITEDRFQINLPFDNVIRNRYSKLIGVYAEKDNANVKPICPKCIRAFNVSREEVNSGVKTNKEYNVRIIIYSTHDIIQSILRRIFPVEADVSDMYNMFVAVYNYIEGGGSAHSQSITEVSEAVNGIDSQDYAKYISVPFSDHLKTMISCVKEGKPYTNAHPIFHALNSNGMYDITYFMEVLSDFFALHMFGFMTAAYRSWTIGTSALPALVRYMEDTDENRVNSSAFTDFVMSPGIIDPEFIANMSAAVETQATASYPDNHSTSNNQVFCFYSRDHD